MLIAWEVDPVLRNFKTQQWSTVSIVQANLASGSQTATTEKHDNVLMLDFSNSVIELHGLI